MPVPYHDYGEDPREKVVPMCQKCFERAAVHFCKKCGCPLCLECMFKHVCSKEKEEGKKEKD